MDTNKDNENEDTVIENTTCFAEHAKRNLNCEKCSCRMWIENSESNNCGILMSQNGSKTLQEIGDIFGITRMRVCQIEKNILNKLSKKISKKA